MLKTWSIYENTGTDALTRLTSSRRNQVYQNTSVTHIIFQEIIAVEERERSKNKLQ